MSTTEPYSPMARAKASPVPLSTAGSSAGSTTDRKMVRLLAPSEAAACSTSRSASISTGCTERTTNGSVTKASATITPGWVALRWIPTGLCGPYSDSSTMLATMVGRANGRSMMALAQRLPGNSSRTSTQAISVPITALTSATTTEISTVTFSAASALGAVTASHQPARPSSNDLTVRAASGSSTMTLSHRVTMP